MIIHQDNILRLMINFYNLSAQKSIDFVSIISILVSVLLQHPYGPDLDFKMLSHQYYYISILLYQYLYSVTTKGSSFK